MARRWAPGTGCSSPRRRWARRSRCVAQGGAVWHEGMADLRTARALRAVHCAAAVPWLSLALSSLCLCLSVCVCGGRGSGCCLGSIGPGAERDGCGLQVLDYHARAQQPALRPVRNEPTCGLVHHQQPARHAMLPSTRVDHFPGGNALSLEGRNPLTPVEDAEELLPRALAKLEDPPASIRPRLKLPPAARAAGTGETPGRPTCTHARTNETKRFPGWTHPPNLQ